MYTFPHIFLSFYLPSMTEFYVLKSEFGWETCKRKRFVINSKASFAIKAQRVQPKQVCTRLRCLSTLPFEQCLLGQRPLGICQHRWYTEKATGREAQTWKCAGVGVPPVARTLIERHVRVIRVLVELYVEGISAGR